ncbi:MFS transporter [Streptomyces sp. NPDC001515]
MTEPSEAARQPTRAVGSAAESSKARAGGVRRFAVVFTVVGVRRALVGALIARLAQSMYPVAILLTVRQSAQRFSMAGLVVACFGIAIAVCTPLLGRLIDRHGTATLIVCAVAGPLGVAGLVTAALTDQSAWLVPCALVAGAAQPPITPALRTLLAEAFADDEQVRTAAYGVDAISVEATFVIGPAVVGAAVALAAPYHALLGAAVLTAVGALVFLSARPSRRPSNGRAAAAPRRKVRTARTAWMVSLAGFAQMFAVGMVEVGTSARVVELGAPAVAGPCLAVWAGGAVTGGLVFSARSWQGGIRAQYAVVSVCAAVGFALLAAPASVALLLPLMFAAGLATTPAAALASTVLSSTVPSGVRTEAFAWFASLSAAGGSLGILLAGTLTDHFGAQPVFLLSTVLPAGAALVMAAGLPHRSGTS